MNGAVWPSDGSVAALGPAAAGLAAVRRWRRSCSSNGLSPVTTAKAYRLLRAIMNTAVDDGLIRRNPCRIKGAGDEDSAERSVLTVPPVYALANAVGSRYRALLLLATFASLRSAQLAALTPQSIDLDACTVRVTRQINYPPGGGHSFGSPRIFAQAVVLISFPDLIVPDLRKHLDQLDSSCRLSSSPAPDGKPLRHSNFYRRVWMPALSALPAWSASTLTSSPYRKPVHRRCGREPS